MWSGGQSAPCSADAPRPLEELWSPDVGHTSGFDPSPYEPARAAFEEGIKIFAPQLTRDPEKKRSTNEELKLSTLNDVLGVVNDAKRRSERNDGNSQIYKHLVSFSEKLLYYGKVVDVLGSHHPEYASLAWGAMKFVFSAVIEHERTALTVITALCEISDSLASVELAISMYPHDIMLHTVSTLYAHIIQFLIRALNYYDESKIPRAMHAITPPSALRYNDLIEAIRRDKETARRNATASNQAEFRLLHQKVEDISVHLRDYFARSGANHEDTQYQMQDIASTIQNIRQIMEFEKAVRASDRIQIQFTLSEIQLQQALTMISSQCPIDHKKALDTAVGLQKSRQFRRSFRQRGNPPFWNSSKLREWNHSQKSSAILLKSTIRDRNIVRSFCTNVVEHLVKERIATLWIFSDRNQEYTLMEVLRSLVFQALSFSSSSHFENKMTFQMNRFQDARFEEDFLNLLADLLQSSKIVYIIAATDAMQVEDRLQYRACLCRLSSIMASRGSKTMVKIINASYGSGRQKDGLESIMLDIGKTERNLSRAHGASRGRRHNNQPLGRFVGMAPM